MKRSYRRHRNPQTEEKNEPPFFSRVNDQVQDAKPFFSTSNVQMKGLAVGKPDDKYEREADSVANAVVNQSNDSSSIQKKNIDVIQRVSLATPAEDEKLNKAEQRNEEDKLVQEKPEEQSLGEKEEEDISVQKMQEDEEAEIQKKSVSETEEDDTPIQAKSEANAGVNNTTLASTIKQKAGKGKPLQRNVKHEMESAFRTDFSGVNVHTDDKAVNMNKSLHAQAFTHGKDIYFNAGKYNPESSVGKHLLAHELTHVIQQNSRLPKKIQRVVCRNQSGQQPERRAQGERNALDDRARLIIGMASEETASNAQKAVNILNAIICYYYNPLQSLVRNISYDPGLNSGLMTTSVGSGRNSKGDIKVSGQFIQDTNASNFARRVLQVGHELTHIQQYQSGLSGDNNKNEREFLAFYENALADEFVGTGRMSQATRRVLIDAALGHYYCLSVEKQAEFQERKTNLLNRRSAINNSRGNSPTTPPTICQHN